MSQEKTVSEAIHYRRSVRIYDNEKSIDKTIVKKCIEQASLAPNSSNMQLWEFYHITSKDIIDKIAPFCFNQNAAKTAQQLVVFVVRKDLWKKRAKANLSFMDANFGANNPKTKQSSREKVARNYYGKIIPFAYADFLGILGYFKFLMTLIIGLFKPIYREVRKSDMRIVAHKTCGLAAQNFMLSMAAEGYDTCPMEGSDTWRIKNLLGLPFASEVNMIVSCGIRKPEGVYGDRFRIPFDEVYKEV
ncbi:MULTISPECIES: nitroreductase family protein [unclassified Polaribacter]|jgi:nitroreductase|uniref:nitroreductase family protein n=1 Tax=unclassified Polaribacter TaxID=196858 RepID=UPI00052C5608|nr:MULTISPECIES: nitroreductase family protein [unclassified Polaribacter]KGL61524.1 nitroreductase family protein [Polaribacter sp. Hel1_33_49]MBT7816952.1 nitroreductase family protein [Polaribacter sp.]MDG1195877.1 nitroreductase family protein [Polaribacter sp.]MDG1402553.1 nitroreductase family protein [Polaribacter sp.]PKV65663.1 nitroreductase [Polaribacter sp. Hel1_33_96]